jgi:hypothetical protein
MIRLRPTAISLSPNEIDLHLQRAMLRHTMIINFENLDVDSPCEDEDDEDLEELPQQRQRSLSKSTITT